MGRRIAFLPLFALALVVGAEAPEPDGTTALHRAALAGDLRKMKLSIEAGARVDAANRYGVTPLSLAAANGDAPAIRLLIEAGAKANAARPGGETPLMSAALTGKADAVQVLLEHGANPNAREDWHGQTAIMWAAAENHAQVVAILAAHGADVNARSKVLEKPKLEIVDSRTDKNGLSLQVLQTTFPRGGFTPLLFACRQGSYQAAEALLAAGAAPNVADPDGIPPISLAIRNGHYDLAALLLEMGANVNGADDAGRTPLYIAVEMHSLDWLPNQPPPKPSGKLNSIDLIELLLEKGANPNAQLRATPPPWKEAPPIQNAFTGVTGPGTTPFVRAAKNGDLPVMRLLLSKGADPNLATRNGTTALMAVVGGLGRKDLAELRIAPEEEDNAIAAIGLCMERGARLNAADDLGQTPLHGAAMIGASRVARFLVERGAETGARNRLGFTPVDEALRGIPNLDGVPGEPHTETAELLRKLARKQP